MGNTWSGRPRRWSAAVLAALCLLVGLSSNSGAATASSPEAYFVDQNGTVNAFVEAAGGTTLAAIGGPVAPPNAPITAVRAANGALTAFTVGGKGEIRQACPTQGTMVQVAPPGTVGKGAKVRAAVADGQLRLAFATPQGFMLMSEVIDPCGTVLVHGVPVPVPWGPPGGDFVTAALTDGRTMIAAIDKDGAPHAAWVNPDNSVTDSVVPGAKAKPGAPITATPTSNATAAALTLFYLDNDGDMVAAHPAAPGALVPPPVAANAPAGAPLAAAAGPNGDVVTYVNNDGAVTVLPTDPSGAWQPAFSATGTGFATKGSDLAITASAFEDDIYCGNGPRPVRIKVSPHGPGLGTVTWPSGPPNTVGLNTEFAAY